MSATYARVTPSLPCGNPNASRTDERPVQLTQTNGHVDNPGNCLLFYVSRQIFAVERIKTNTHLLLCCTCWIEVFC